MPDDRISRSRPLWLWVALAAFLLAAVFVNPLRVTTLDDDWAYSLTVRHLLDTGTYQLHDWAAANMPFQAYVGALFSMIGGFSFAALRLSTLLFAFTGLIGFYNLSRESDLDRKAAGLLTLIFASSPLVFRFSLDYMTDMPFLAMLITALWLYARAIRTERIGTMIVASLAAAAAVLTRQFGMAVIGAVFLMWIADRRYRPRYLFFAAGLVVPAAASLWQLWWATLHPTWGQAYAKLGQAGYFADKAGVALQAFWRPATIAQYMAFFALPLVLAALASFIRRDAPGPDMSRPDAPRSGNAPGPAVQLRDRATIMIIVVVCAYLVIALFAGPLFGAPRLMPLLPWNFDVLKHGGTAALLALTIATTIGAALLAAAIARGSIGRGKWHVLPPAMRLLTITTAVLLLMNLVFFKIGDEYVIVFLPFTLLGAGRYLREPLARYGAAIAAASLIVLAASALWTRGLLESEEASWRASDMAAATGATPDQISGSWNWDCYHGAFDEYLASIHNVPTTDLTGFFAWYRQHRTAATYAVAASRNGPATGAVWTVRDSVPYHGFLLDRHYMYLLEKK